MTTLRIGGMGSGMDISSLIGKILEADTARITSVQEEQDTRNQRIGAWLEVKDKLADLTQASDTLRWMDLWRQMAPTSSNPAVATASASQNAASASYAVEVFQLARAHTIASASGLTTSGGAPLTAATPLVELAGVNVGDQFVIAGQTFTITADDTLSSLRDTINTAAAGMPEDQQVTASILDNRLVLQRTQTGEDPIVLADTTGSFLQSVGVLDGFGNPANELLSAQNAFFSVNGAVIERSANTGLTDVLEGVTLNFYGTGTSEITVGPDTEAIKTAIQTFVDAYNAYAEIVEFHGQYDNTDPTNPIPGLLQDDSMAREIIANIRRTATQLMSTTHTAENSTYSYNGNEGVMNSLQHVGIWTTGTENRLSIVDMERLDTLLEQEPEMVEQLFRGVQSPTGEREGGIALSLYNVTRDYSSDLDGWIDVRIEGIDEEIKRYDETIDRMISAMEAKESLLWKQFNAMDEAVGAMNQDLDWLLNSLSLKKNS